MSGRPLRRASLQGESHRLYYSIIYYSIIYDNITLPQDSGISPVGHAGEASQRCPGVGTGAG